MLWIRFDEEDHRKPAPNFCLPSPSGQQICRFDYHEDWSLALVFAASRNGELPVDFLNSFARRIDEYRREDARVLAVVADHTGASTLMGNLPFGLVADPGGQVRKAYAGLMAESLTKPEDHLVFLLDSYGAPYAAVVGQEYNEATLHSDILKWLQYIGLQCPE